MRISSNIYILFSVLACTCILIPSFYITVDCALPSASVLHDHYAIHTVEMPVIDGFDSPLPEVTQLCFSMSLPQLKLLRTWLIGTHDPLPPSRDHIQYLNNLKRQLIFHVRGFARRLNDFNQFPNESLHIVEAAIRNLVDPQNDPGREF